MSKLTAVAWFIREVPAIVVAIAVPAHVQTDPVRTRELAQRARPHGTVLLLVLTVQAVTRAVAHEAARDARIVALGGVRVTAERTRRTRPINCVQNRSAAGTIAGLDHSKWCACDLNTERLIVGIINSCICRSLKPMCTNSS